MKLLIFTRFVVATICLALSALHANQTANMRIAIDTLGNQVAVWEVHTLSDSNSHIWSSFKLTTDGAWRTPVKISAGNQDARNLQLVMDAAGDTVAAWTYVLPARGIFQISAASFTTTAATPAWSAITNVSTNNDNVSQDIHLFTNSAGQVGLGWSSIDQTTDAYNAWASLFSAGTWTSTKLDTQ